MARSNTAPGTSSMERIRLAILGADEDVPRGIFGAGKACGGDVAVLLKPTEGVAFLGHIHRGQALVWEASKAGDAPKAPSTSQSRQAALARLGELRAAFPEEGPASLRSLWSGVLVCQDGQPYVQLQRKVANYATLSVQSSGGKWTAKVVREARWFSKGAEQHSAPKATLAEAIRDGLTLANTLVGEACSFRDTRRRGTVDPAYAEQHPPKPAKTPKDPTERYVARHDKPVNAAKPKKEKPAKAPKETKPAKAAKPAPAPKAAKPAPTPAPRSAKGSTPPKAAAGARTVKAPAADPKKDAVIGNAIANALRDSIRQMKAEGAL